MLYYVDTQNNVIELVEGSRLIYDSRYIGQKLIIIKLYNTR